MEHLVDVCIVTTIHPPFEARIWDRGVRVLADAGLHVGLVSTWKLPEGGPTVRRTTVPPATRRAGRILVGVRCWRAARAMNARAYQFHDIDFLPFALILRLCTRRPVVYDRHENYPEEILHNKEWIPRPLRAILAAAVRSFERLAVHCLGYSIAPTEDMVRRLRAWGAESVLVRNITTLRVRRDLPHDRGLVYSGSLSVSYGFSVLLDMARYIKSRGYDLPLVLTERNASDSVRRELADAVSREALSIAIVPHVPPAEIHRLLRRGCIGLVMDQPSEEKRLAIPSKVFEYLAHGLPVVGFDLPNLRRILETSGAGRLVRTTDAAEYVEACQEMLADPIFFERLRENGYRAMETVFRWDQDRTRLLELFKRLIGVVS